MREDQIRLFGFASEVEREWFRLLLNVQGVGTKVALAILSTFKTGELATVIAMRDVAAITRTPGVGRKLAERLVLDLKDKAPAFGSVDPAVIKLQDDVEDRRAPQPAVDAISALEPRLSAGPGLRCRRGRHEDGWRWSEDRGPDPPGAEGDGAMMLSSGRPSGP